MRSYTTAAEFQAWPTGLDVTDLVAGGTTAQQTAQLNLMVQQASSLVDQWCYQPLYARTITETSRIAPNKDGTLHVRVRDFPLKSVTSAQWRQTAAGGWNAININLVDVFGSLDQGHQYIAADASYGYYYGYGQPKFTVQSTYVAGYVNMAITANAASGVTALTVDSTLGVQSGDILKVYDGASYEEVTVTSVPTSLTTLDVTATQYAHNAGVRISELPDAISTAAILWTAFLAKERRAGGSILMDGKVQSSNMVNAEDVQMAKQLLQPFRRVI